jgi:hypothetical protein
MSNYEMMSVVIAGAQALTALVGLILVVNQLSKLAEQNKIAADAASLSVAMAVVQLEQAVATSRGQLAEFAAEMHERKDERNFMEAAVLRLPELIEQYLNNADRLCSYIIRGYIDEDPYREDFRNWLTEMVRDYRERFGADSRHRNILHVHHAWADGKKARNRELVEGSAERKAWCRRSGQPRMCGSLDRSTSLMRLDRRTVS